MSEEKVEEKIKTPADKSYKLGDFQILIVIVAVMLTRYLFQYYGDVHNELEMERLKAQTVEEVRENYLKTAGERESGGEEYHMCIFDYYIEKVGVSGFVEEAIEMDKTKEPTLLMNTASEACIKYADETLYELSDEYFQWLESKGHEEPSFESVNEWLESR